MGSSRTKIDNITKPSAIPNEMIVLGSMLISQDAVDVVFGILKPEDFYRETHEIIFGAMRDLYDDGQEIDWGTIFNKVKANKKQSADQWEDYLKTLSEKVASPANAEHNAMIVKEKSVLRQGIDAGARLTNECLKTNSSKTSQQILLDAEQQIFALINSRTARGVRLIGADYGKEIMLAAEAGKEKNDGMKGIPTGIPKLDLMFGGWQKGDMIIIAGRPSHGKSNVGFTCAKHAAIYRNIPTLLYTMEMTSGQVATRILCSMLGVNSHLFRMGKLSKADMSKAVEKAGDIKTKPLFVDDSGTLTPTEIRARTRRAISLWGIELVIIDYMGLISPDRQTDSTYREVTQISRQLKDLGKELQVPVVVMCQLNREVTKEKKNPRPNLGNLRDSGAIEQDADIVLFVHRPGMYKAEPSEEELRAMDLIVAKNRNGPIGTVKCKFYYESGIITDEKREDPTDNKSKAANDDTPY